MIQNEYACWLFGYLPSEFYVSIVDIVFLAYDTEYDKYVRLSQDRKMNKEQTIYQTVEQRPRKK